MHSYTANGTYVACLTITTSDSCTSSYCDTIVISCIGGGCPDPVANFSSIENLLTATFTDLSTSSSGILSWYWNFGDGGSSTLQNPVYTFANDGIYAVCLDVTDSCGTDSYCDSVTVIGSGLSTFSDAALSFNVYPNPGATFNVEIDIAAASDLNYAVVDLQGRAIKVGMWNLPTGKTVQQVDLTDCADGLYFLQVSDGIQTATIQLMKTR